MVPTVGTTVAISGRVKKPGIYEMPEGAEEMTLAELLELAGGPLRPKGNRFSVIAFDEDGRERISDRQDLNAAVGDGEIVVVARGQDVQLGGVELAGHVRVPGRRSLSAAPSMRALLGDADSLDENPYLLFAALETTDPVTRARRLFPVSLQRILAGEQDFRLRDNDTLIVLGNDDVRFLSSERVQNTILLREVLDRDRRDRNRADAAGESAPSAIDTRTDARSSRLGPNLLSRLGIGTGESQSDFSARQALIEGVVAEELDSCGGIAALEALVVESRPGRFANAVRAFGLDTGETESVDRPCPRAFQDFPDLLPFVLEHVAAVNGEVRVPGVYPIIAGTPLSHLVAVSGGTTLDADLTALEISRYSPDRSRGEAVTSRSLVDLGEQDMNTIQLGPGDVVRFNQVFSDRDTGPVFISGEVARPGFYQIRRGERLSEVIARAGGVTPQAYPFGAVFTRERVRRAQEVGFRRAARELNSALALAAANRDVDPTGLLALFELTSELSDAEAVGRVVIEADPTVLQVRPELDTVLEPADRLFMPKRPNSVLVIGDVLSPGALQFVAGTNVDDYIRQAGGFQRSADEDRIFVVFPNGAAQPVSVSVWNYSPIQVPPGSTIVVPKDPAPLHLFQLTRDVAQVAAQLAVTAASLAVIGNN